MTTLAARPPEIDDQIRDPAVARLLARVRAGDAAAAPQLLAHLQDELHGRAERLMRGQPVGHTLQATALVNEACARLLGTPDRSWKDIDHLLSVAAKAMRCVLVDHARAKRRDKRNSDGERMPLDAVVVAHEDRAIDLVALDEALEVLADFDPAMARAVELRFFAGLTVDETARQLGMAKRTFERNWALTKKWLYAQLR